MPKNLSIGDPAPLFTLNDTNDQIISLKDFIGHKNVVLYFYPKDNTPGCTLEAQNFSDQKDAYDQLNAVVIGVSQDSVKSHQKFCQLYGLKIILLADPEHQVIEQYGAWQEKSMMGKSFMGTVRSTYLIDKNGIIQQIWPKVTPKGHEQEVLMALKQLTLTTG